MKITIIWIVIWAIGFSLAFIGGYGFGMNHAESDEPTVEVGPVGQCPPCPDAGPREVSIDPWAFNVLEKAMRALRECDADRKHWQELAEQCTATKLEVKR